MDLGVLEGQTSRGLFTNSIFDPSVIGANVHHATVLSAEETSLYLHEDWRVGTC